ncbi:Rv2175c family DNA-binding protein [Luteimicrobium subarcticum]|uniref:Rv2175c C-terminal domain-containing protein n=1 Tax=Luteimicrobium subarcticum TaxID=620910 RepID=A0A2M8WJ43_9MICO|nr:Rv2175c family DNA-binding protein [Luteimicrobium subarcticum]PJI90918.1 hypothetical protein CLV34_2174 [Luteimicrobium subarcticum]
MDIHDLTAALDTVLGPTLVASLAGTPERDDAVEWADDDGPRPAHESELRLRIAYKTWEALSATHDEDAARQWFLTARDDLDGDTPLDALATDRGDQVLRAAESSAPAA